MTGNVCELRMVEDVESFQSIFEPEVLPDAEDLEEAHVEVFYWVRSLSVATESRGARETSIGSDLNRVNVIARNTSC